MTGPEYPAAVPPTPPALPPATPAPTAHPSAGSSAEGTMAADAAKVQSMMGTMSGADTLLYGGAALLLILGEFIFGVLLSGGTITIVGVLAGEVLLFTWFLHPAKSPVMAFPVATAAAVVGALVVAIVIFEIGDFIEVLKNFGLLTSGGLIPLLYRLCRWAGAVLMALGLFAFMTPSKS
ncbi:MAG TPA: hypothetical protein VNF73_09315 [Candidatus Saccharimonadales bacterium]|nr:hypothetical protein [Candidatus Saccharimonadales bacterium]